MNWRDLAASIFSDSPTLEPTKRTKPTEGSSVSSVSTPPGISKRFTRPSERGSYRRRFPYAAQKLDDLREVFGSGVRVAYARQGQDETGVQLHGVPISKAGPPVTPTPDCDCSACHPTKTAMKYRQREPGAAFGLDRHGRFRQSSSYRRDLEQPWERFVEGLRRR